MSGLQRTQWAVEQQLSAMGAPKYEIGVCHEMGGMVLRQWTAGQVWEGIPWLRHKNATGHHIYVRPASSLGTIMLDDLSALAVSQLRRDGLQPAVVLETSPANYQCWLRLIHNVEYKWISTERIHVLLKELASQYGGDPRCVDWRHFGRNAEYILMRSCVAQGLELKVIRPWPLCINFRLSMKQSVYPPP